VGSAGALRYPFWERVLLAGHYAWYLYLAFGPHNSLPAALAFFFVSRTTILEEVAKFRAARRMWARIMRDRFGAKNPKSWMLRFHTQTAGVTLTAQQPENNIVRTAYEALAAVLGGTQSLHTNSMDETLSLPTEKAVKIALRTQQILAEETEIAHVADPRIQRQAGMGGAQVVIDLVEIELGRFDDRQ
jgi:methylmalonyl-CoA mutase cobalamin-binding domain/chain